MRIPPTRNTHRRVDISSCVSTVRPSVGRHSGSTSRSNASLCRTESSMGIVEIVPSLPFRIFARTADHESSRAAENDAVILRCHVHDHARVPILVRVFHFNGQDHHSEFKADAERRQRMPIDENRRLNLQSHFRERFAVKGIGQFFEVHFHGGTAMVQFAPLPRLRLVERREQFVDDTDKPPITRKTSISTYTHIT